MVVTAAGLVAIETIQPGDVVLAADEETGEYAYKEVVRTFVNTTEEITHVTISNSEGVQEVIDSTPQHPFYVEGKGWVEASALHAGMTIWFANGTKGTVEDISNEGLEEPVTVYNFEVADFHTYFVGECGVLVHNTCITDNQQKGKQYQKAETEVIRQQDGVDADSLRTEVTLKPYDTSTGTISDSGSIRVDVITMEDGSPIIYEMKSSQAAPYTPNQKAAGYGSGMLAQDYIVVGSKGGDAWPTNTVIPAGTKVETRRPGK